MRRRTRLSLRNGSIRASEAPFRDGAFEEKIILLAIYHMAMLIDDIDELQEASDIMPTHPHSTGTPAA